MKNLNPHSSESASKYSLFRQTFQYLTILQYLFYIISLSLALIIILFILIMCIFDKTIVIVKLQLLHSVYSFIFKFVCLNFVEHSFHFVFRLLLYKDWCQHNIFYKRISRVTWARYLLRFCLGHLTAAPSLVLDQVDQAWFHSGFLKPINSCWFPLIAYSYLPDLLEHFYSLIYCEPICISHSSV